MKFKQYMSIGATALIMASSSINAATDGRPGLSSTGQIFIRLEFNQSVQVSNLKDIELVVDGNMLNDGIESTQLFCIRGSKSGYYRMVANSDRGGATPFSLTGNGGEQVGFQLFFNGNLASNVLEPLQPAVPSQNYSVKSNGVNCNGEDNAEIAITIPATELQNKNDQIFTGYLSLTVSVE